MALKCSTSPAGKVIVGDLANYMPDLAILDADGMNVIDIGYFPSNMNNFYLFLASIAKPSYQINLYIK